MSLYYNNYFNASYPQLPSLALASTLVDAPLAARAAPYWPYNGYGYYPRPLDFGVDSATVAEIESRVQAVAATQRAPIVKKEVIPVPGPLGRVRNIVRRLPTPQPDVLERTFVVKPGKDQVNILIEKPLPLPTRVVHKQVVEDPGLPVVNHSIVSVAPRKLPLVAPVYEPTTVEVVPTVEQAEVRVEQTTSKSDAQSAHVVERSQTQATTLLPLSSPSATHLGRFGSYYGAYPYARGSYYPYGWY